MKTSRTSNAGRLAAVALASTATPGLPSWATMALTVAAAISVAYLGHVSADCPPGCPGTDDTGRPRPSQGTFTLPIRGLPILVAVLVLLAGCTTPSPTPPTGTNAPPSYVPDPAINAWSNAVVPIAETAGAVVGLGPTLAATAVAVFALIGAVSASVARRRSQVADTLAAAIHDGGPEAVANAMAYASDTPVYPAVAATLNAHCATGEAPGQPTPQSPPQKTP